MNADSIDWRSVLGAEIFDAVEPQVQELHEAALKHAPRAIRLNPETSPQDLAFDTSPVPWFTAGRYVSDPMVRPGQFLQHAAGDYYVQDAGSMLALALCEVQPGQTVCDACAAPGGKSTGLLEQLQGRGGLVANEVISSRLATLKLALARSGQCNYMLTNCEIERLAELCGQSFHCVLVDAPCSGQSMVAQSKQSMSAFSENQICHSSARQRRIIRASSRLVRPGGRLVYSTCTFSSAENEQIIRDFLADHPGWQILRFPELETWECGHAPGCYRLWPHRHGCSGAFAAALQRLDNADRSPPRKAQVKSRRWQPLSSPASLPEWLMKLKSDRLFQIGAEVHRFPAELDRAWIDFSHAGCPVAKLKSAPNSSRIPSSPHWQPLFAAAKALRPQMASVQSTELREMQAMRFVAGESIRGEFAGSGWTLVTWLGRVLSWGKLSSEVLKNHFPKGLRQSVHT